MKLTEKESKALKILSTGRVRYQDLSREMDMSPAGLSKLLKRLQQEKLIKRIQDNTTYPPPVYYELTEKGRAQLKILGVAEALSELEPEKIDRAVTALFSPRRTEEDEKILEEIREKIKRWGL